MRQRDHLEDGVTGDSTRQTGDVCISIESYLPADRAEWGLSESRARAMILNVSIVGGMLFC